MAAPLNPSAPPSSLALPAGTDPVTILLVDDQPGRLLSYHAILEPLGEHLVDAMSGADALKFLMDNECALILLDVNMPGMDGFETASMIHQHPRFEKTPIIFVTAVNVSDLDRMRGYKLGAVDYVMVPVIPEIMRSKVMVLAELYRKRRELQLANERLATANEALRVEKARELELLNASLRNANTALGQRNIELQAQIGERERAQARLLQLDRRKDEFLATLAHELRNPLASLCNAVNVLKLAGHHSETGTVDRLYATMERQLALLVRLIDDLLDVARISQDKLTLRPVITSLQGVLEAVAEMVMPMLHSSQHTLNIDVPAQPVPVYADPTRLGQVFSNLISNAGKYSDPGTSVDVQVALQEDGRVLVHVRDQGIGLAPKQTQAIFEPFAQVDTTIERSRGGLGIGLTLVKRLVEMHGGRIDVHSDGLGQGSCFSVNLPLSHALPVEISPPALPEARSGASSRVLVVDDNRDSADTLALMLELLGHDVRRLYNPFEAQAVAESYSPDIVFLDIGMPGISGYDVARLLRASSLGPQLTLVAVTGWGQPEDRRRTAEAGFDHHLVKPPDLDAICRIVDERPGGPRRVA